MNKARLPGRKLLVASLGVAAVSYSAACHKTPEHTGNLMAPDPVPTSTPPEMVGNLVAPMPEVDAGDSRPPEMVGNLMPPPPEDAGPPKKPKLKAK